jgi:hypothetical protein
MLSRSESTFLLGYAKRNIKSMRKMLDAKQKIVRSMKSWRKKNVRSIDNMTNIRLKSPKQRERRRKNTMKLLKKP